MRAWQWACGCVLVGASLGCAEGFAPPSEVTSLRVLAVAPEPASGVPGEPVELSMLLFDGRLRGAAPGEEPPPAQVVWIAGCHNPPSRQFFGCYPLFEQLAEKLAGSGDESPPLEPLPGVVGMGTSFEFMVPSDILESAPRLESDPIHFGVSYVFFAACAGELRLMPGARGRLPLGCFDLDSGAELGAQDYVEGFTTVFTYENATNHSPSIEAVRFAGTELPGPTCERDADCDDLEAARFSRFACGREQRCVPVVKRCDPDQAENCPEFEVFPIVDPDSIEPDPGAVSDDGQTPGEIVWLNFYADAGSFASDTRLVNDRETGFVENHGNRWRPESSQAGSVQFFTTLHDNRGGATWRAFEVLLEDP